MIAKRKHKYGAIPTEVDGIRFASKAEAKRYGELKLLERAGLLKDLKLQPKFICGVWRPVKPGVREPISIGTYIADFEYYDIERKEIVVEDVKGMKTPLYRWKKKHVEAQYGITIEEIQR